MSPSNRSPRRFAVSILLGALLIAACEEGLPTGPDGPLDCATSGGMSYSGTVEGSPVWSREDGPHRLSDTVQVSGTLTIEAGALVCGEPGSVLAPAALRVAGTSSAPVVLTATDSLAGWGGILAAGPSADSAVIRHAMIRHAGVRATAVGQTVVIDSTTIFRSPGPALGGGSFRVRGVVIDSACAAAVSPAECWAVSGTPYNQVQLADLEIRNSGGGGVLVAHRGGVTLTGVSITSSRGVGIHVTYYVAGSGQLTVNAPLNVTDGDTIPLVAAGSLPSGLASREAQLQLLGNAIDEVHIQGPYGGPERQVYRELPWVIHPQCVSPVVMGTVRLEAGASLTVQAACDVFGQIVGNGTAADPVLISSDNVRIRSVDFIEGAEVPPSIGLTHARITRTALTFEASPALLADLELDQSSLTLAAAGSRLSRAHVHGNEVGAAQWMAGHGVIVSADDVTISDCTIEDNAGDAVRVTAGAPRVERCNLWGNEGLGVRNMGAGVVDAADNWWGDAAGPAGPAGDGVAGPVTYEPFRLAPVVW